jgi:prevent-host-death family protein
MGSMKTAGLREARHNFSALLEEVRQGREVVITDRGRAIARLVPPLPVSRTPFRSHAEFRARHRVKAKSLSQAAVRGREDRF